jgi:hypothetical protein
LEYKIGFFTFFSLVSAFVLLVEGWFRRDDGGSVSSGALTERERERAYYYIRTRILAKIKRSFYSYFSHF